MGIKDPVQLWKTALAQIEIKLDSPAQYKTYFHGTRLVSLQDDCVTIGVANPYMHDWLQQKYSHLIKETLTHVYGDDVKIEFVVEADYVKGSPQKLTKKEKVAAPPLMESMNAGGVHFSVTEAITRAGLNDKYSMKSYIVGGSNQIAYAAAQSIIADPGESYNPFFIHGSTGVGKTHLAQAVGRAILERSPVKKVVYTSSEGFLNDMVKSIRNKRQIEFRNRYRAVDMLIIDDIQLISKWVATQDEFFNTFNHLYEHKAHIILISDRPPEEIKDLEDRLRSRFQGGIVVDISVPDMEMRLAILERKNESAGLQLPRNMLEVIASGVDDNIRELEGALQKVALFNQMKPDGELTIPEIRKIIGDDTESRREKVSVPSIIKETARSFGVTATDIKGKRRTKDVALARQVVMYILREEYEYNLEDIARHVKRNDHTTVIHGVDKVGSRMRTDDGFKTQVVDIIRNLQEGTRQ